jgi:hypothetical protein
LACWRGADGILERDEFAEVIRASLAAVDENRDPSWIFLVPPPGEP